MKLLSLIVVGYKALTQLGLRQILHLMVYKICLHAGVLRLITLAPKASPPYKTAHYDPNWFFSPPPAPVLSSIAKDYAARSVSLADEIANGKARLFGGLPQLINLIPEHRSFHWSAYEKKLNQDGGDIKFTWEPARFDWAITLAKAYYLSDEDKYAASIVSYWSRFAQHNPVNIGPNWQSGQEIALRLLNLVICLHFIKSSPALADDQMREFIQFIAQHAERIPKTIGYAKAQNNNHLISESVALYCAGLFVPSHPEAKRWRILGRKWFQQAIRSQIDENGEYTQHSTNYHRMMLTSCLWLRLMLKFTGDDLTCDEQYKLALAAGWLAGLLDETSGQVPNLGHNDGSFIQPFTICEYGDYRPIIQASSNAFLGKPALPAGEWDDLCLWLGIKCNNQSTIKNSSIENASTYRLGKSQSWAYMRAARFTSRPAHADQLHVDIWHQGINLTRDAGTYQYNALPPWQNGLASTQVHNTICMEGRDQMVRAGRFLWLDWAQAKLTQTQADSISAVHYGYQKFGLIHQRKLERLEPNTWLVTDFLLPAKILPKTDSRVALHWLIGDWSFHQQGWKLVFTMPSDSFSLKIWSEPDTHSGEINIIRAGVSQVGFSHSPLHGWWSPTYGIKEPALSILATFPAAFPLSVYSEIRLGV